MSVACRAQQETYGGLISAPQDCEWAIPGLSNSHSYIGETSLKYLIQHFSIGPNQGLGQFSSSNVCMYVFIYLCMSHSPNSETIRDREFIQKTKVKI